MNYTLNCELSKKEKLKIKKHEYYLKNRKHILIKQRKYEKTHKKENAARNKRYRKLNADKIKGVAKIRYEKNKEIILKKQKVYGEKNKERIKKAKKRYRKLNRKKCILKDRNYYYKNIGVCRAKSRKYHTDHRDELLPKMRKYRKTLKAKKLKIDWYDNNKELVLWCNAKKRAKDKNVEFNLDRSDIIIPEYDPVFKEKLIRNNHGGKGVFDNSPSVDRVDSSKGYIKGNICVISHRANQIKSNGTLEEFIKIKHYLEKILKKKLKSNKIRV